MKRFMSIVLLLAPASSAAAADQKQTNQSGGYQNSIPLGNGARIQFHRPRNRVRSAPETGQSLNKNGYGNGSYSSGNYGNGGYRNGGFGNGNYSNRGYSNRGYINGGYGNRGYGNPGYGNPGYGNSGYGNSIRIYAGPGYTGRYQSSYGNEYGIQNSYGSGNAQSTGWTLGVIAQSSQLFGSPCLYVSEVNDGSVAETMGIQQGDYITAMNGYSVRTLSDFRWVLRKAEREGNSRVRVTVFDSRTEQYVKHRGNFQPSEAAYE